MIGDRTNARVLDSLLVALPVGLSIALGLWGLGRPSMYGSEADSWWAAHLTPGQLVHLLAHIDAVHGLYYLALHAWLGLGGGVAWMRALSLLGVAAAVAGTYAIGRRVAGRSVALSAAGVLALTPYVEEYAQNGRSYALVMAVVTGLVLSLLRAAERADDHRAWLVYGAAVVVAGYLHEMTLLLQVAFAITLVAARTPGPVVRRWLVTSTLAVVAVLPLVLISYTEAAAVRYLKPAGWTQVGALARIDFGLEPRTECVLLVLALVAAVPRHRTARAPGITIARLALPMLVTPPAILVLASHAAHSLYDSRYVLYGTVAAALLVASGAARVAGAVAWVVARVVPARAAAGAVAVGLAVAVVPFVAASQWHLQAGIRTAASRGQDYGGAATYLARRARPGDAYVFVPLSARSIELGYPRAFARLDDIALHRSPLRTGTFLGSDRRPDRVRAAVAAQPRVWVIGRYPSVHVKDRAGVGPLLRSRFRLAAVGRYPGIDVMLFVRGRTGPPAPAPAAG